jgi:Kef-type K+ transport system membrane component KefB
MFDHKTDKLVPLPTFLRRVALSLLLTTVVLCLALSIGVVGYHEIARLSWIDAILNASMILTGMGPVAAMTTNASKLFASGYALFSGVVFLTSIGLLLAPMFHRILHKFHLDDADENQKKKSKSG